MRYDTYLLDSRLNHVLIYEVTPTKHCVYEPRSAGAFVLNRGSMGCYETPRSRPSLTIIGQQSFKAAVISKGSLLHINVGLKYL